MSDGSPDLCGVDQYWHQNKCRQTSSSQLKGTLTPLLCRLLFFFLCPRVSLSVSLSLSSSQCPPSPLAACKPSRSTPRPSVSRGRRPTLSSSTASTRATRSVSRGNGGGCRRARSLTGLSEPSLFDHMSPRSREETKAEGAERYSVPL